MDSDNNRPSLKVIAEQLGVSLSTVSLALRDDTRISLKRREEVKRVAQELGYRPDPLLSSFIARRNETQKKVVGATLAWVNCWENPQELRKFREFDAYWMGANQAAGELGYKVEEFVVNDTLNGRRLGDILLARGIKGILIPPHGTLSNWKNMGIEWEKFNVVRFGFSVSDMNVHMVGGDQASSSKLAVEQIYQAGYRTVGFVTSEAFDLPTAGNFRMGYLRSVDRHPDMVPVDPLIFPSRRSEDCLSRSEEKAFMSWFRKHAVDAILTSEIGLKDSLKDMQISVPEDLGLALTSVNEARDVSAGIDQNPMEIGRVAAQVLIGEINRNTLGAPQYSRRVLVEGSWVEGDSLPWVIK